MRVLYRIDIGNIGDEGKSKPMSREAESSVDSLMSKFGAVEFSEQSGVAKKQEEDELGGKEKSNQTSNKD